MRDPPLVPTALEDDDPFRPPQATCPPEASPAEGSSWKDTPSLLLPVRVTRHAGEIRSPNGSPVLLVRQHAPHRAAARAAGMASVVIVASACVALLASLRAPAFGIVLSAALSAVATTLLCSGHLLRPRTIAVHDRDGRLVLALAAEPGFRIRGRAYALHDRDAEDRRPLARIVVHPDLLPLRRTARCVDAAGGVVAASAGPAGVVLVWRHRIVDGDRLPIADLHGTWRQHRLDVLNGDTVDRRIVLGLALAVIAVERG